jgi:mRNA interferase MazF
VPDRGDFIWLNFDPQTGHEQAGRRPALVLSPRHYNAKAGLALCCPVTSQVKGYVFEVPIEPGGAVGGTVLADQLRSLDWRDRKAKRIAKAPAALVNEVFEKLILLLGPEP